MRIIPVIDLQGGRAVRGHSGDRARYGPVRSRVGGGETRDLSEPLALLTAYRGAIHPSMVYVADLDRITGRGGHDALLDRLVGAAPEVHFLVDGGFTDAAEPSRWRLSTVAVTPVLGTETLRSLDALPGPGAGRRLVLSLDLGESGVIGRSRRETAPREEEILERARLAQVQSVILLLLDRVGTFRGLPRERLLGLRRSGAGLDLIAGGGVAGLDDLKFLRDAGFAGALVASALHDGQVSSEDLRREGFLGS
jgi:phosphoribosylformimino-5-aminoimidazole carboxamide ribotide isomerase